MAHVLYRFYSATGQLLYVGITMNPSQRFKSHRDTKDWWGDVAGISIENYDTREDLENAERRAIQVEHPLHNIIRAKPRVQVHTVQEPTPTPDPEPMPDLSNLFGPPASSVFAGLFNRNREEDPYVVAQRERYRAMLACTLCDSDGYLGKSVCVHVDPDPERAREARRQVQKDSLQVIPGGDS